MSVYQGQHLQQQCCTQKQLIFNQSQLISMKSDSLTAAVSLPFHVFVHNMMYFCIVSTIKGLLICTILQKFFTKFP